MCRLFAMTSDEPQSPIVAMRALDVMREGHDGSGVGLFMSDLGGPFEELKGAPILSGIFTNDGLKRLDEYMMSIGFLTKYKIRMKAPKNPPPGTPVRDVYLIRAYDYPEKWEGLSQLKELGDPLTVAESLNLDRPELHARLIMAQGRQNTNYAINLYACHPFFIQGIASMTNGENTAFVPIREFLMGRGFPGYIGYQSDSEVFTHIMHYTLNRLGLSPEVYKHIITPLQDEDIEGHPNGHFLRQLKHSCRRLIIDGPNCVIGRLPDNSLFVVQDRKKLRPAVVGGKNGTYVISSEMCGLESAVPDRDRTKDFQPMYLDTVIIPSDRSEVRICSQMDSLPLLH